jgi:hypothetical protein
MPAKTPILFRLIFPNPRRGIAKEFSDCRGLDLAGCFILGMNFYL